MDVIHSFQHSGYVHNSIHYYGEGNSLHTLWGTLIPPHFLKRNLVGWSAFHRKVMVQQGCSETTKYVYGGCSTEFYSPDPKRAYEKADSPYFLYLSRFHPTKRPEVVLALAKRFPDVEFVFGSKPGTPDHVYYGTQYLEYARKLPNVKHVEPTHEEKRELYRKAKAVIFPSVGEAFGLVCVESLACGTGVIASNDGAFREIIEHGKTGFLCSSLDEFARAIKMVDIINPKECRCVATEKFSRQRVAREYLEIYKDIANGDFF